VVNGSVVIEGGEHTGQMPGVLVAGASLH
jgi:hypothetical protein